MLLLLLRLCVTIFIAFLCGRLIAKLKLPSILGWLICAMILGPHAVSLINQELLDAAWYQNTIHVMECAVGLMIGTELVWKKIKRSGKAIVITTLTQLKATDDKRASYYRYFTGKDFGSAENYDICLNSSALGIEECVRILKDHYLDITPSKT